MVNPTIVFTQDTMFEIFKQSATKFGLIGSAKIYVTEKNGVLETQHIAPEEITPGGIPKVTGLSMTDITMADASMAAVHQMD